MGRNRTLVAVSVDDDSRGARLPQSSGPDRYGKSSPFRPARQEPLLTRVIPVAGELPGYRFPGARRDLVAGVTVAALAVPAAMAYAELAGLSPVNGLYALLLPSVAYVLLGSSRQLIIGPEGSVSTLIAAAILPLAAPASGDAAALAAMLALLAALLVVAAAIAISWALDLQAHGVAVVGAIPSGLPGFTVPKASWADIGHLAPAALGIFFVSFADEILTARSFAG